MRKYFKLVVTTSLLLLLLCAKINAQNRIIYKQIDSISLSMDLYFPQDLDTAQKYPTMIFF